MKKIFLMCFVALSACAFVGCDKEDNGEDLSGFAYTLSITPTTVSVGDEITLTIKGDNVGDHMWTSCFNRVDNHEGSCLMPKYENGVATLVVSEELFSAGQYKFYAEKQDGEKVKTNYVTVTVK